MWRLLKVLTLRAGVCFFPPNDLYIHICMRTCKGAATIFPTCVAQTHGPSLSRALVLNTSFPASVSLHSKWALTLWNTESGLWSRSPLLVTEISAAELLWISSAMVLSCQEGGRRHEAGYSLATVLQAQHTGPKVLGCHLVDAAAMDRNGLDRGMHGALSAPFLWLWSHLAQLNSVGFLTAMLMPPPSPLWFTITTTNIAESNSVQRNFMAGDLISLSGRDPFRRNTQDRIVITSLWQQLSWGCTACMCRWKVQMCYLCFPEAVCLMTYDMPM